VQGRLPDGFTSPNDTRTGRCRRPGPDTTHKAKPARPGGASPSRKINVLEFLDSLLTIS
jgi:hypothetical protein